MSTERSFPDHDFSHMFVYLLIISLRFVRKQAFSSVNVASIHPLGFSGDGDCHPFNWVSRD